MGRKVGLTVDDVVDAGAEVADREGLEGVTLAEVAKRLGVRSPSLYAHVEGLSGLRRQLALRAAAGLQRRFVEAIRGKEGSQALRALAHEYRHFALSHPGLYEASQRAVAREEDPELYDALASVVVPVVEALVQAGVPDGDRIHVTRGIRSALHGFVTLERGGGFGMPEAVEESFQRLVELLVSGVEHGGWSE
jgi:AcrR family transcriptional regulator